MPIFSNGGTSRFSARADHAVDLGPFTGREVQMKVLSGKYPRLAIVALIVSIALASGAAKKWA